MPPRHALGSAGNRKLLSATWYLKWLRPISRQSNIRRTATTARPDERANRSSTVAEGKLQSGSRSPYSLGGKRVWVAGHRGMVGAALVRRLASEGCEILTVDRREVDLTRQEAVEQWMSEASPHAIFLAAAKVGGILANDTFPAEFLYENLMIEANIIHAAWKTGVEKLLFLGSSCIYPKHAPQPISEDALLSGPLEPTNEWYAVAKITGIKLA